MLAALIRLEHLRHPLTRRADLPAVLQQVAEEVLPLAGAASVRIALCAAAFTPPFVLAIAVGDAMVDTSEPLLLQWGGITLAEVRVAPPCQADSHTMLLLRVATESLAEVWASERMVAEVETVTRARIAFDLHDAGKQVLPAIRLFAERAERDVTRNPAAAAEMLRAIREIAQQGLDDMTFWLGDLHGHQAVVDFSQMLARLLDQTSRAAPHLTLDRQIAVPTLPWQIAACLLGMLRGALANVVLHAKARTVQVSIQPTAGGVLAYVCDDGMGIDVQAAIAAPGIGLESMLERARALGGWTSIGSGPVGGTCLEIWLPLPDEEAACG